MFLDPLIRRNQRFVAAAVELHRDGHIPANSLRARPRHGRSEHPHVRRGSPSRRPHRVGDDEADRPRPTCTRCNRTRRRGWLRGGRHGMRPGHSAGGHRLGHVGHLVQVPSGEAREAAAMQPAFWTVFSDDKAGEAARRAPPRASTSACSCGCTGQGTRSIADTREGSRRSGSATSPTASTPSTAPTSPASRRSRRCCSTTRPVRFGRHRTSPRWSGPRQSYAVLGAATSRSTRPARRRSPCSPSWRAPAPRRSSPATDSPAPRRCTP